MPECPHCNTCFGISQQEYYLDIPIACPWCGFEPEGDNDGEDTANN